MGRFVHHGGGNTTDETNVVVVSLLLGALSDGTTEDILVLLLWEVDIIVSVWMWVLSNIISVILPSRVRSKVSWVTEAPVLHVDIAYGSTLVIITNGHSSLIGLVINSFSSKEPLSLLSKTFENVIWANLHNANLFIEALLGVLLSGAALELSDFSVATSWDSGWLESHELRLKTIESAETTILVTKGLVLSVWVPVVVRLVVSVIFVEGVIDVTIDPGVLWDVTEVEGHLGVLTTSLVRVV